ncbi:MAG: TM2 domain-containing protein [Halovenus sp.]
MRHRSSGCNTRHTDDRDGARRAARRFDGGTGSTGDSGVRQPTHGGQADSEKVAAGILAILLGGLGAHKFYQGNVKLGVIYLCFFWTAIPAVLGLIEGILVLIADDREYAEKYADGSFLGREFREAPPDGRHCPSLPNDPSPRMSGRTLRSPNRVNGQNPFRIAWLVRRTLQECVYFLPRGTGMTELLIGAGVARDDHWGYRQ